MKTRPLPILSLLLLTLTALALLPGCKGDAPSDAGQDAFVVVATTTMLADLATEIGGQDAVVRGIMKPGGDPHLYKPTPGDARMIAQADVVLTNGLKLEGWIDDLVRNAGGDAQVVVTTEGIDALKDPSKTNYPDPHVWHDVSKWMAVTDNVRDALVKADPAHAEGYRQRAAAYQQQLRELDAWVKAEAARVPEAQRVLVTSHDAFQYYGARYGFEVVAVQGLSTESEAGARDVARVIEVVRQRKIPSLFIETSVNPKLIEQISRETGATIGGSLYSDSLGDAEGPGGSYIGMIRQNTRLVTEALGGGASTQRAQDE